jgi:hypothetical protein
MHFADVFSIIAVLESGQFVVNHAYPAQIRQKPMHGLAVADNGAFFFLPPLPRDSNRRC